MKRYTQHEATRAPRDEPSGINPYPRLLMMCGAALIACGFITPAGTLLRNVVQGLHTPGATAASATAAARMPTPKRARSQEGENKHKTQKSGSVVNETRAIVSPLERKRRDEVMEIYAQWKDAWVKRDINAIMKLYSPRLDFRLGGLRFDGSDTPLAGFNGRRSSFIVIWSFGASKVTDVDAPSVTFDGQRAILLVGQRSQGLGVNLPPRLRTMRYTLERAAATDSRIVQGSKLMEENASASSQSRTWRIVREERLHYQGSSDVESQVF
jgi:hypothetical protein